MKKVVFLILIFIFNLNIITALEINSKSAIMYNLNEDMIIYEKYSDKKLPIASLTKIITAITVIDSGYDLEKYITISYDMIQNLEGYSKLGLKEGDKLTIKELLYALMLPSAGDATQALAFSVGGSIENFSAMMNNEIKKIGVSNSNFNNPIGIDSEDNYSTAYDMAQILKYSLKNSIFKEIFETNEYYISSIGKNINKTLVDTSENYNIDYKIIKGSKTGFTYDAGFCLASTSALNNINYLIITLGADINYPYHIKDSIDLYDYYSNNYSYKTVLEKDKLLIEIPIKNSHDKIYKIYSEKNIDMYLENSIDIDKIRYNYIGIDKITNKIKYRDKLGLINIEYDGKILYSFEVYLNTNIKYYNYKLYISLIKIILIIFIIYKKRHKSKF